MRQRDKEYIYGYSEIYSGDRDTALEKDRHALSINIRLYHTLGEIPTTDNILVYPRANGTHVTCLTFAALCFVYRRQLQLHGV